MDLGWADLASAIDAGDDVVLAVVSEAAERLGDAAVSLVNLFDIKRLVIGGRGINGLMDLFRAAVTERTNTRSIARGTRTVSVEASIVGEDVGAIGAASLVLHGSYAPHLSVLLADVP